MDWFIYDRDLRRESVNASHTAIADCTNYNASNFKTSKKRVYYRPQFISLIFHTHIITLIRDTSGLMQFSASIIKCYNKESHLEKLC